MKRNTRRVIKTYKDDNDIVIFQLMQGQKRLRTVHTFGYGTCHGIWLKVEGLKSGAVTMTAASAAMVKEQIAQWGK